MLDFAEGISATTTTTTAATATDRRLLPPPPPPLPLLLLPIATWLPYLTREPRKSPWTSRPYGCAAPTPGMTANNWSGWPLFVAIVASCYWPFFTHCTHAMNHPTTAQRPTPLIEMQQRPQKFAFRKMKPAKPNPGLILVYRLGDETYRQRRRVPS